MVRISTNQLPPPEHPVRRDEWSRVVGVQSISSGIFVNGHFHYQLSGRETDFGKFLLEEVFPGLNLATNTLEMIGSDRLVGFLNNLRPVLADICPTLNVVSIIGVQSTADSNRIAQELASWIADFPWLLHIDLCNCKVDEKGAEVLMRAIQCRGKFVCLDLTDNCIPHKFHSRYAAIAKRSGTKSAGYALISDLRLDCNGTVLEKIGMLLKGIGKIIADTCRRRRRD